MKTFLRKLGLFVFFTVLLAVAICADVTATVLDWIERRSE